MVRINSQKGFALVAAIMAMMVLTAVGLLAFALSTQDIRISSRLVGEKKAFSALEAGVHRFTQTFDPANLNASAVNNIQVDPGNDMTSLYTKLEFQPAPPRVRARCLCRVMPSEGASSGGRSGSTIG